MALDTATKRFTISHLTLPWRMVSTVPDNDTSGPNRIADGYLYAAAVVDRTAFYVCVRRSYTKSYLGLPKATGELGLPKATGYTEC